VTQVAREIAFWSTQMVSASRFSANWPDVTVVLTEHAPAAREIRTNTGANTLSVALLPVERALWRVDDGPTLTKRILPATTSIRASREIVWARWEQTCKCIHVGLAPRLLAHVARESEISTRELEYCEGVHDPLILQCALSLGQEAANHGLAGELYVQSIAHMLAVHVLRKYTGSMSSIERPRSPLSDIRLERAKDYIEANLAVPLSLEQIAKVTTLSVYHFARSFKEAIGLSPHRYVTQRRIELAKVLLISTRLPIAEVARRVGIHNQSHFAAHFRKLVGCSPAEFRNRP
jgi:AraC family transcriptional regulator